MMEAHRKHYMATIVNTNNNNNDNNNNNKIIKNSIHINNQRINDDKNNYSNTATTTMITPKFSPIPLPSSSSSSSSLTSSSSRSSTKTTTTNSTSIDSIYLYYRLFSKYSLEPDSFTYSTLVRAASNSSQVKHALRLAGTYFNPPLLRCAIVSESYK